MKRNLPHFFFSSIYIFLTLLDGVRLRDEEAFGERHRFG